MGQEYFIYAEGKVKDKWHLLDGSYLNTETGRYEVAPAYLCCSRSSFALAYDEIQRFPYRRVGIKDLSTELAKMFRGFYAYDDEVETEPYLLEFNFKLVSEFAISGAFDHYGYVRKDILREFKSGEREEIMMSWDGESDSPVASSKEFWDLSPEERSKTFEYFEWDDWDSALSHFKKIKAGVEAQTQAFQNVNYLADIDDIRLILWVC